MYVDRWPSTAASGLEPLAAGGRGAGISARQGLQAPAEEAEFLSTAVGAGKGGFLPFAEIRGQANPARREQIRMATIELQFKQKEVVMTVVDKDGSTCSLPFGYKQWLKAASDGYPPYSVAAKGRFKGIEGPFQVAGSYAWTSSDALRLKVHYVNWISALGLTLRFEDNKVLLTVTENYSSGEGVTFEGTLAH